MREQHRAPPPLTAYLAGTSSVGFAKRKRPLQVPDDNLDPTSKFHWVNTRNNPFNLHT
jgi:hypothetical protein